jgi:membrane protein DedA with SNARE-associated domain
MLDFTQIMEGYGYPGIIFIVALENLFPPIPSEVVLPFAGFMAARGILAFFGVVLASTIGSVLGALILYYLGYSLGRNWAFSFVNRFGRYIKVTRKDLSHAEDWFSKYGPWTVFFCRMIPVVRSIISIPAGLSRMPLPRFITYTAMGTVLWNFLLVSGGVLLESAWPRVETWVNYYKYFFIAAAVISLGC